MLKRSVDEVLPLVQAIEFFGNHSSMIFDTHFLNSSVIGILLIPIYLLDQTNNIFSSLMILYGTFSSNFVVIFYRMWHEWNGVDFFSVNSCIYCLISFYDYNDFANY